MIAWYLTVLRNYAYFGGRARRREYWSFQLVNFLIIAALEIPVVVLNGIAGPANFGSSIFGLIAGFYALGTLVPSVAASVRRLHDTGRSGWWFLIALVPIVGGIVLLIFHALDSEPMPNRWGPSPKATTLGAPLPYASDRI